MYTARDYILHGLFFNLYGLFKYWPSPVGDFLRYLCAKPFMAKMGKVRIYEGVTLWFPYRIYLGNNITLNEHVYILGYGEVRIEDGVRIGHRTSIMTADHIFNDRNMPIYKQGSEAGKVHIKSGAWIGCNVTILKDVVIGCGAVIAAGSVVNSDVQDYTIVAGVPAKIVGERGK